MQSSSKVTLNHILDLILRKVHCAQVIVWINYNLYISKSRVICQMYITLEHNTSHKSRNWGLCIIWKSWINNLSIDAWFVMIGQYLKIWNLRVQKKKNIEKIMFKDVQMKFLIKFTLQISSWNMILISNDFWHKIKMYNFDPYNG